MINYSVGDVIVVNKAYVEKSLSQTTSSPSLKQTLEILGGLSNTPATVADVGNLLPKSWIRVVPTAVLHPYYRNGRGVTIFFASDSQLNDSFELSRAFIQDKCFVKVYNNSGSAIVKNQFVRQTGYDVTLELPTVSLASAAAASTSVVFGVAVEDIADGQCGSILVEGSIIIDTSSFSAINDSVYLSDTPGAIATTAGTVAIVVGRILQVSSNGAISVFGSLTSGANTGGSGGGGGGGSSTPVETRSSDSAISSGDDGKILYIPSPNTVTLTFDSGLAEGFEISVIADAGASVTLQPASGQRLSITTTSPYTYAATDEALVSPNANGNGSGVASTHYKLVSSTWQALAGVGFTTLIVVIPNQWQVAGTTYLNGELISLPDIEPQVLELKDVDTNPIDLGAGGYLVTFAGDTIVDLDGSPGMSLPFTDMVSGLVFEIPNGAQLASGQLPVTTSSGTGNPNTLMVSDGTTTFLTNDVRSIAV